MLTNELIMADFNNALDFNLGDNFFEYCLFIQVIDKRIQFLRTNPIFIYSNWSFYALNLVYQSQSLHQTLTLEIPSLRIHKEMIAKQSEQQCQQLDQLLLNLVERKQPPDMNEALNYRMKRSVKFNSKKPWSKGAEGWAQFGPGVNLYFSLLKYLSILFILLFINALPSLLCNLRGNGLRIYHQNSVSHFKVDIMKASLANVPIGSFDKNDKESKQMKNDTEEIYAHTIMSRFIIGFNDFFLTIIIALFFIFWEIKSDELVSHDSKSIDLPSYRTLVMDNIFSEPQLIEFSLHNLGESNCEKRTERKLNFMQKQGILSPEELWQLKIKNHFEKFGKVDSVTIIYDYGETLQQLIIFNLMVKEYSECQNSEKSKQFYDMLRIRFQMIKQDYLYKTKENNKAYGVPFLPKKAFVTFHSKEDRNQIKNLYKYRINLEQLKFSLFNQNSNETDHQKLIPIIRKCHTQPVSIKWQNFHRKKGEETRATLMIGGFLCVILCMALVAILLLSIKMAGLVDKTWQMQLQQNSPEYNKPVILQPTFQQASKTNNVKTLYNFCSSLQLSYSSFQSQQYHICEEYFNNFAEKWFTMLALSTLILIINLLLNLIIKSLAEYRRHRTTTQRSRFLIVNIFLVYFVNMVLLILLIRADFNNSNNKQASLIELIRVIFPNFQPEKKIQTYPEFNRKWYIHIGNQLLFNYVVSLIICPWLYVVMYWLFDRFKCLLVNFKAFSKNQAQLNYMLLPLQFDFQTYYAMILVSFYICMVFGTSMPLFYLLGSISFLSLYISNQLIFYHLCKVPELFDHSINTLVTKILFFALAAHQLVVIFFLYAEDIFPSRENIQSQSQTHTNITSISQKLKSGWVSLCLFVLMMIFSYYKKEVSSMIRKKFFEKKKSKELNEQQIMKEIDINTDVLNNKSIFQEGSIKQNELQEQKNRIKQPPTKVVSEEIQNLFLQRYYYRMQDNPLYINIYYTLTVFHKIVYNNEFRPASASEIQFDSINTQKVGKN